MTRPLAAVLFAAAALLVATSRPGTTQTVPTQTAHWQPPVVLGKADAARLDRIAELQEQTNRLLEQIAAGGGPAAVKAKGPDKHGETKSNCGACHTPAKADKSGGGFILFGDDKAATLKPLSAREKARVKEAVESGDMPPNRKLSPAVKAAITSP